MRDSKTRSIVKSITWRILGLLISFVSARAIGLDYADSVKIMLLSNAAAVVMYYIHERMWNKVNFGRK